MNTLQNLMARRRALIAGNATEAGESGFTLIELMVVVLIIAILMAIAIPTFLGSKGSAQDRGAQEDARNVLTNVFTIESSSNSFAGITQAQLNNADPAYTYAAASGTIGTLTPLVVGWQSEAAGFQISVDSQNKNCWMIWQPAAGATIFGEDKGASCATATAAVAMPAAQPATNTCAANPTWQTNGYPFC